MARIKIFDHIPVQLGSKNRTVKLTDAQFSNGKKAVYATVKATHAARVTGNNGFYLPSKMAAGAASMVAPYEKPIKAHHKDTMDPVGRIKVAKYLHTPLQDNSLRHLNSLKDNVSFSEAVDLVDQLNDSGVLNDRNFAGLGYILSTGLITDPDAVDKVLDGRYQTVSIEAYTDKAVCSICREDWAQDGRCEHSPGEIVDGKRAFLIAGELEYDGWDWVNTPADQLATVIRLQEGSPTTNDVSSIANNLEEGHYIHICDSVDEVTEVYEIHTKRARKLEDEQKTVSDKLDDIITRIINFYDATSTSSGITEDDREFLYQMMSVDLEDAELSVKSRKDLPNSAFCGPDRSFPAPDHVHVEAARKLIDRYKGSGDKSKILACFDRKSKKLDCSSESEDSKEKLSYNNNSITDSTEDVSTNMEGNLKGEEVMEDKTVLEKLEELIDSKQQKDSVKVTELQDQVTDLQDKYNVADNKLTVLRDELRIAQRDAIDSSMIKVEAITDFRKLAAKYINLVNALTASDAIEESSLAELSLAGVADFVNKQADKIADSLEDILAKLTDGTTPVVDDEPVVDPTLPTEAVEDGVDVTSSNLNPDIVSRVKTIRDDRGAEFAKDWLGTLFSEKIISTEDLTEYAKILVVSEEDSE